MAEMTTGTLPLRHAAIIMDGNGRWAKKRALPRSAGHVAGVRTTEKIIEYSCKIGLEYLTLYAFSTENWKRPESEVSGLLNLLNSYLDRLVSRLREDNPVYRYAAIRFLGDLTPLSEEMREKIAVSEAFCRSNPEIRTHVNIAFNYGGKDEIVHAVNRFISENPGKQIDEKALSSYLYFAGQPDPDLIIRTGGEMRLSNFLMWESSYSEFYSTATLWPDFSPKSFNEALTAYSSRSRRFGGV